MNKKNNYIPEYIFSLQSEGKLYFSLLDVIKQFPERSKNAIQLVLSRLSSKGRIKHIMKGFYCIIPPEYLQQKMIPPELFIDPLFKHLSRKYYVGLLSAAFYHGSSHQQPQEYFVMINKPSIRTTELPDTKINYVVNTSLGNSIITAKKSRTGYFNVSSIEQTAIDLFDFQEGVGGIDRVANILNDLLESLNADKLSQALPNAKFIASVQRLGYMFDIIYQNSVLAKVVEKFLSSKKLFPYELKPGKGKSGFTINNKWKIIENDKIEID